MRQGGSGSKVSKRLIAASSAAVMAVYAAGYVRTQSAANYLEQQSEERRQRPLPAQRVETLVAASQSAAAASGSPAPTIRPKDLKDRTTAPDPPPAMQASSGFPEAAIASAPLETPVTIASSTPPTSAPEPATPPAAATPQTVWKDGTYLGWGHSRHGDIQSSVLIEGGRIVSAKIAQCLTRYSCDVIDALPPQVTQRQSPEVDFVSGATQSTDAFYYGVVEALAKAK